MLDEKTLQDMLTTAAEEQNHLLLRAVTDDIASGHRRLMRNRLLAGTGMLGVVAGLVAGTTLVADPGKPDLEQAPVATTTATATTPNKQATTPNKKTPPRSWARKDLGPVMRSAVVRHLDPGKDHLQLDKSVVPAFGGPGVRQATLQVGWRIAGQAGQGRIWLELADSERAIGKACGAGRIFQPVITCRQVRLANGRTAQVANRGDEYEVGYVRADGSVVYIVVSALFHQNTNVPVHGIGITQQQLLDLAQDASLRLPPLSASEQAEQDRVLAFNPDPEAMYAALERVLGNGQLTDAHKEFVPEQATASATWQPAGSTGKQYVAVSVDVKSMVSGCKEQIRVDCKEKVTLPDGRIVWFGEDTAAGRLGARYEQPDGDMAFVAVGPAKSSPPGSGVTRQQAIELVTDAALNEKK